MTAMADDDFRIEHDTMGEVRVPAAALYKAQTQRAVENFPIYSFLCLFFELQIHVSNPIL